MKFSVAVEMDEENITATGADKVEFLFSPNPGQNLRPLKNIASGGEISRVMLGLKTVLAPTVPIMVFDDSLSAVDSETDAAIRHALRREFCGCTVILISHRVTTLMHADHIVVLDEGRVSEMGTHAELIAAGGIYSRVCSMQGRDEEVTA